MMQWIVKILILLSLILIIWQILGVRRRQVVHTLVKQIAWAICISAIILLIFRLFLMK